MVPVLLLGFDTSGMMSLIIGLFFFGAGIRTVRNPFVHEDASEAQVVLAKVAGVGLVLVSLFWFFLAYVGLRY